MTDIVETFAEAALAMPPSAPVPPWKPLRWTRRNTPRRLRLIADRDGTPLIPGEDLAFLLNANAADILSWRFDPRFPRERRHQYQIATAGYAPGELISFLKSLPQEDQARVCPALPLGPVNALRDGLDLKVTSLAFEPTLRELLVTAGVMIFTAALSFFGIMAAAG